MTKIYLEKSFTILKYMINHPKSEIFIYFCRDIMNHTIGLEKVRSFRLLPMTETDVNISISREADGFVSYMDCYNIKQFSESINVSKQTLRNWDKEGKLTPVKLKSGHRRYTEEHFKIFNKSFKNNERLNKHGQT
jgi:hypothetical protein